MGKLDSTKCLQCHKSEQECKCEGGYKIIYYLGVPRSKKELVGIKSFDEAKSDAEKEIENIQRLLNN